jgi:hypothetical protein
LFEKGWVNLICFKSLLNLLKFIKDNLEIAKQTKNRIIVTERAYTRWSETGTSKETLTLLGMMSKFEALSKIRRAA